MGLFSEKTEVIVKHATTEELEKQIRTKLSKIINAEKTINTSFEVIDDEMGTLEKEPEGEE